MLIIECSKEKVNTVNVYGVKEIFYNKGMEGIRAKVICGQCPHEKGGGNDGGK